jgi:6-phosphogluconolactonase (cycloisomerase 2 family)
MRTFAIRPLLNWFIAVTFAGSAIVAIAEVPASLAHPRQQASEEKSGKGSPADDRVALYASVGAELIEYSVDVKAGKLVRQGSVILPGAVQEGWLHPTGRYLYVAWSDRPAIEVASPGEKSGVTAFRIDSAGTLHPHGSPAALISRPVYVTGDVTGTHIVVAYNDPSGIAVYSIAPDGTLSTEVKPAEPIDVGVYAHSVRVNPSNQSVILVTRGNKPANGKPEDPGALKILSYKDGVLRNRASIAPAGGYGFQARHLDFHPSKPWLFLTLEAQNKIDVFKIFGDGTLSPNPLFVKDTIADPKNIQPTQGASTIHVHPNGKFVYVGNRAGGTVDFQGKPVFRGGENSIGVFQIDQETGEPVLIQSADTHGFSPRTFSIDPSGRLLVAGNQAALAVRDGNEIRTVAPGLTVFRIQDDGRLEFVSKDDVDTKGKLLFCVILAGLH